MSSPSKMLTAKDNMSFWSVTVFNTKTQREETFKVAGDKRYRAKDIKRVLREAHPEYTHIKAQKTRKPKVWHQ